MPDKGFPSFLERSLSALERDVPVCYRRLSEALAKRDVHITVDNAAVVLSFDTNGFHLSEASTRASVEIRVKRETLLDLIEGAISLESSILDDRFWLRGSPEALERFYEALLIYLDGAVRSPALPTLLEEYRREPGSRPEVTHA